MKLQLLFFKEGSQKIEKYYYHFVIYNPKKNMIIGNYPDNIGKRFTLWDLYDIIV
jgi:hypothetical protein